MQIAAEVRRTLMKRPGDPVDLNDFKVKFKPTAAGSKGPPLTPEQKLAVSKASWINAVGAANVKKVVKPRE
jgi:hypothetical protein